MITGLIVCFENGNPISDADYTAVSFAQRHTPCLMSIAIVRLVTDLQKPPLK